MATGRSSKVNLRQNIVADDNAGLSAENVLGTHDCNLVMIKGRISVLSSEIV